MKNLIIILLIVFISFNTLNAATYHTIYQSKKEIQQGFQNSDEPIIDLLKTTQSNRWGVFWVNFIIGAIGMYSLYGFSAGIISAGLTYFIFNGEKKAFIMGILGALAGIAVGLAIRLAFIP